MTGRRHTERLWGRDANPAEHVDRQLGWLMSLGGATLVLVALSHARQDWVLMEPWWNASAIALLALCLVPAVLGDVLPFPTLRVLRTLTPPVYLFLLLTWAAATAPTGTAGQLPWIWEVEAYAVTVVLLVAPWQLAAGMAVVTPLVVPATMWLAGLPVTTPTWAQVATHVGNVAFVAIFVAIRTQLSRLAAAGAAAAEQERDRIAAVVAAAEHRRTATIVHDEILATLALAARSDSTPAPSLVAQAARAQRVLDLETGLEHVEVGPTSVRQLAEELTARVDEIVPAARLHVEVGTGSVPQDVAEAVLAATGEALRNMWRHARDPESGVLRAVDVDARVDAETICVEIRDHGPGFDPRAVPVQRLGIRHSIVGRMQALTNGSALVRSTPSEGTRVTLRWHT
ncbi:ATP-binding protein [Cellulosimicrobium cellulans]|uniref:sensor histidine kinase n=1 Tax=Cellulosimicrobium cellulans TaxID=1710 RepID=UPI001EDA0993|nr:ATP-binding protein [Cellulosimicrobium cellulans]UKJ63014.1 ATP-binding protein [Cellulosimicrobium cellulans]